MELDSFFVYPRVSSRPYSSCRGACGVAEMIGPIGFWSEHFGVQLLVAWRSPGSLCVPFEAKHVLPVTKAGMPYNKSLKPTPGRVPAFGHVVVGAAYLNR